MSRAWRVLLALAVVAALSPTTDAADAELQFACAAPHTAATVIAAAELDDDLDEALRDPQGEMAVGGVAPALHRGPVQHLSPALAVPTKVCWPGRSPDERGPPTGPTQPRPAGLSQTLQPFQALSTAVASTSAFNFSAGPASVDPGRPLNYLSHILRDQSWPQLPPLTARSERNAPWPS